MSFVFPPSFEKKYPDAMKNLRTNAHRLSTPFDIHATLRDIYNYSGVLLGDTKKVGQSSLVVDQSPISFVRGVTAQLDFLV